MLRKTFAASCSAAVLLLGMATSSMAQGPLVEAERLPISFSNLSADQAHWATELFAAHHQRVQNLEKVGELSRERFDGIFEGFVADFDRLLAENRTADKSSSDCNMACSLTQSATSDICAAGGLAATALAACPSSIYAVDADYYANIECQTSSLFTVTYACMGPSGQSQALGWLDSAKRRSLKAWNNAWYSYSTDGCSQNYQTALEASDAYVNFHNARFYMSSCN